MIHFLQLYLFADLVFSGLIGCFVNRASERESYFCILRAKPINLHHV